MPRRRVTHLDGGRGCRVRPPSAGTGMGSLPASIAVAVVAAGHAGVYKRDEQSAATPPWDCSSAAALPSRSLAIRSRDGAAHLFT
jgi:tRNA A58 N-methylase Trm61